MSAKREKPLADPVTQYALDVVGGKYVTGRLVRLACERHLRDLEEGHERGLWFDADEAGAAVDFWRICPHSKGKWAGETIQPEPWQTFIIGSVYGWKKADGKRRFRVVWVELGRKNGKTTLVYPAGLHGLIVDGEGGAEVYSVATKKDQSKIPYKLARQAVLRVPEFAERIQPFREELIVEETASKFEALGSDADTLDGLNMSVAICDEIHKWKGRDLWDVIDTATGAREQPLIWVITTAGREGSEDVYGQEHDYTVQVVEGIIEDDSRFGYVACLDAGDDWTDPANIVKANPNLGVSLQQEEIEQQITKAKASPAAAAAVKRLRLGIRSQDEDAWLPLPLWDAGRSEDVDWNTLEGAPHGAGLDLASSYDFAAYAECYPIGVDLLPAAEFARPWGYAFRWKLWMPKGWQTPREEKLRKLVQPWCPAWLEMTEGDVIDHNEIEAEILRRYQRGGLVKMNFDPWNATQLSVSLQGEGVNVEKFLQNFSTFAAPMKKFSEIVAGKRIIHDGSPCIRWMADNAVVISNAATQTMLSRKKSKNKIDGIVAAVMALNAATTSEGPQESYYDTHGVEFA